MQLLCRYTIFRNYAFQNFYVLSRFCVLYADCLSKFTGFPGFGELSFWHICEAIMTALDLQTAKTCSLLQ
jgi:hypothetical protein